MNQKIFALVLFVVTQAHADVQGVRTSFATPSGTTESCVALTHIPNGVYSSKDQETETKFCAIDLYANNVAICPKTWSTSPGTMIYETDGLSQQQYEQTRCTGKAGHTKIAKFKNSMNAQTTSSTFSTSALLYYHFSRYFNTSLQIPVSVYRTIDANQHYQRISSKAVGASKMNQSAWAIMRQAEQNPASYVPTDELFTPDRRQIFGIIIKDKGDGYGAEVEGTEADPWGVGQNNDFQQTPGFMALRSAQAVPQAIVEGVQMANRDPLMAKAVGQVNQAQVAYWMKEISEITILDDIFSQQDRIMNIDFVWEWTWVDANQKIQHEKADEKLPRTRMGKIVRPSDVPANALLLQRSVLNDNDAGGRTGYTSFTKKTQMLEKQRHISADTYRRLVALSNDLTRQGPLYSYAKLTFGLSPKQLAQLVSNTQAATAILRGTCQAGQMHFDVDPDAFLKGQVVDQRVDCVNP